MRSDGIVLALLARQPLHASALLRRLHHPRPYSVVARLEGERLIVRRPARTGVVYRITSRGREELVARRLLLG
jgi:DNA-binding PadR family transcriptional regulator